LQLGEGDDCSPDSDDTSEDRSRKESRLPRPVAQDRTDHSTQPCEDPGGNEDRDGLEGSQRALEGWVFAKPAVWRALKRMLGSTRTVLFITLECPESTHKRQETPEKTRSNRDEVCKIGNPAQH